MKEIPLTQGRVALVDDEDYEWLNTKRWHLHSGGGKQWAASWIDGKFTLMHRLILYTPKGFVVDHKDGNGLNNTRSNIFVCSRRHAQHNRIPSNSKSGYLGVTYIDGRRKPWRAKIGWVVGGSDKKIHLGYFEKWRDAARAYDVAVFILYGEGATRNLPSEEIDTGSGLYVNINMRIRSLKDVLCPK